MEKSPRSRLTPLANKLFGRRAGQSLTEFSQELRSLTDADCAQLCAGIEDGSLTY